MRSRLASLLRFRGTHYDAEAEVYARLKARGYAPAALVDVGAYEGNWTRTARRIFGDLPTLMVEPQSAKHAGLSKLCSELPMTRLAPNVLSAEAGESVTFFEMETGSSLMPERSDAPRSQVTLVTDTLDRVAPRIDNTFIKIDAQGAELQILKGGEEVLRGASLVQLEAAVAQYNEGAPNLEDVLRFMRERGFVMLDIAGHSRIQGYLVQLDLLFVPAASTLQKNYFEF